ncbi:MAG: amidohydrolase family protein [Sheuella sp.]|nr:amidohydrolase family protein [Sheuella sp.]
MNIPNTSGVSSPTISVPPNACDSHMHIYDPKFPQAADAAALQAAASVDEYRLLQKRLGTTRTVVVTPRNYFTDNRVTLDAIARLGPTHTRGVAVLRDDVSDTTLQALHDGGVRGIRFSLYTPTNAAATFEMVEPLAARIKDMGWHVQLHWTADQIAAHADMLKRIETTIVFDHMGRLPQPAGVSHPGHAVIKRLLDLGKTWVKLSGPYLDTKVGRAGDYLDIDAVAQSWIAANSDRMVWGSDWPHPTEHDKPDDAELMNLLGRWTDDASVIQKILVSNPEKLYGFDAISL